MVIASGNPRSRKYQEAQQLPVTLLARCVRYGKKELKQKMLWTIAVILFILWALGLVSAYTMGGFIHILLVLAIVVIVIQLIQGRRVL